MSRSSKPASPKPKVPSRPSTTKARPKPDTPPRRPSARSNAIRRRRNRNLLAVSASAVVVIVIAALVIAKVTGGSSPTVTTRTPVPATELSSLANLPLSSLLAAASSASAGSVHPPTNLPTTVAPLRAGSKPEVLYMGAEYCPFCAAERWPLVMALSKFGSFSNLLSTRSSSTDTNPDTPTFSFVGSTYTSPYIAFTAIELEDRAGKTLQTPTPAENALIDTYDAPPYTSGTQGSIPFIDLGGRYLVSGTEYDGSALSGMSFASAVDYMTGSASTTRSAADAVAAHLIGLICSLTHNRPSSVCTAVPSALKTGQASSGNQGSSSGG